MLKNSRFELVTRRDLLRDASMAVAAGMGVAAGTNLVQGLFQPAHADWARANMPINGVVGSGMEDFEAAVLQLISEGEVPAALLCVSKNGQIVFSRAYGWLDSRLKTALPVNARIGLASLDKIITATAIDILCRRGAHIPKSSQTFSKSLRPFVLFQEMGIAPPNGYVRDPRLLGATVDNLLNHQVGLNDSVHFGFELQKVLGIRTLPTTADAMRYHYFQTLNRPITDKYEYSSAGFMVLRYLIDIAGGGFLNFLKREVFGPAGSTDVCQSHARIGERDPLEVRYVCSASGPSILPEDKGAIVPETEGGNGRYVDYHLVLAASAEAVVRYLSYWNWGTAERLWTGSPAELSPGINNGYHFFNGRMAAIRTAMQQRRNTMCNFALLTNWAKDRPYVKPPDFHERLETVLTRHGWM